MTKKKEREILPVLTVGVPLNTGAGLAPFLNNIRAYFCKFQRQSNNTSLLMHLLEVLK